MATATQTLKIQEGTFVYDTWGYDQTNIDFYKVIRRTEKTAWLQPVRQHIVEDAHFLAEYVEPLDEPTGAPVQKFRVKDWGDGEEYISSRFGLIKVYNNQPKYQSHTH